MLKLQYIFAVCTFVVFCILWKTYDTPFIHTFDKVAFDSLYGNKFITMFHYLGETQFIFTIIIIVLIILWIRKQDYKLMIFVTLSVGMGYGLYQVLKRVVKRPRPEFTDQFSTFSFPSGHAVHGLLFVLTIAYLLNRTVTSKRASTIVWISAVILTILIGVSRLTEGRHFASDVLAGWLLGYSWFILCLWWYKRGNHNLANEMSQVNKKT